MTDRDPRTTSGGSLADGPAEGAPPTVAVEVEAGAVEQVHHGLAAMVAGDVGVQVLPDALDAVRVGAVGRQEVQDDAATERGEDVARAVRGVDAVVVEHEMDATGTPVAARQQPEQLAEQRDVLAGCSG